MLLEDNFEVVSSDASDKMLKTAYKTRWDRRRENAFDNWSKYRKISKISLLENKHHSKISITLISTQWSFLDKKALEKHCWHQ